MYTVVELKYKVGENEEEANWQFQSLAQRLSLKISNFDDF